MHRRYPLFLNFIRELAEAEEFPFPVTENDLRENLSGRNPAAEAALGVAGDKLAGFAVFYETFATRCAVLTPRKWLLSTYVHPPDHRA